MGAARLRKAFERNARGFTDHLSSLFTRTITDIPLGSQLFFDEETGIDNVLIRFLDNDRRPVEVGAANGCKIRVLQRIVPNADNPLEKVRTANYSYAYGFGDSLDEGWLVRYDYVPERAERDEEYEYPVGHVHFNGRSEAYERLEIEGKKELDRLHFPTKRIGLEDFIEHLIVEMRVSTKHGKDAALEVLADSRKTFENEKRTRGY